MKMYKKFKSVELIIDKCNKIESSGDEKDYIDIIDLIISNFIKEDGDKLKKIILESLLSDGENSSHNAYKYVIGNLLEKIHSATPEYSGRSERVVTIQDFIEESKK